MDNKDGIWTSTQSHIQHTVRCFRHTVALAWINKKIEKEEEGREKTEYSAHSPYRRSLCAYFHMQWPISGICSNVRTKKIHAHTMRRYITFAATQQRREKIEGRKFTRSRGVNTNCKYSFNNLWILLQFLQYFEQRSRITRHELSVGKCKMEFSTVCLGYVETWLSSPGSNSRILCFIWKDSFECGGKCNRFWSKNHYSVDMVNSFMASLIVVCSNFSSSGSDLTKR